MNDFVAKSQALKARPWLQVYILLLALQKFAANAFVMTVPWVAKMQRAPISVWWGKNAACKYFFQLYKSAFFNSAVANEYTTDFWECSPVLEGVDAAEHDEGLVGGVQEV